MKEGEEWMRLTLRLIGERWILSITQRKESMFGGSWFLFLQNDLLGKLFYAVHVLILLKHRRFLVCLWIYNLLYQVIGEKEKQKVGQREGRGNFTIREFHDTEGHLRGVCSSPAFALSFPIPLNMEHDGRLKIILYRWRRTSPICTISICRLREENWNWLYFCSKFSVKQSIFLLARLQVAIKM